MQHFYQKSLLLLNGYKNRLLVGRVQSEGHYEHTLIQKCVCSSLMLAAVSRAPLAPTHTSFPRWRGAASLAQIHLTRTTGSSDFSFSAASRDQIAPRGAPWLMSKDFVVLWRRWQVTLTQPPTHTHTLCTNGWCIARTWGWFAFSCAFCNSCIVSRANRYSASYTIAIQAWFKNVSHCLHRLTVHCIYYVTNFWVMNLLNLCGWWVKI